MNKFSFKVAKLKQFRYNRKDTINTKGKGIMYMRKKITISLLCLFMLLFSAGCGSSNGTTTIDSGLKSKITSLGDYKGIPYEQLETEVSEEEIEEEMSNELYDYGEYKALDKTKVEDGDIVNIAFVGTIDGEEFEGGTEESYDLEIGSGEMVEGFEEGIIGADVGNTVEVDVTFPEDYYEADMAGITAHFKITINQIEEYVEPELTDTFVKENMEYESVDDFRNQIRTMLEENKQLDAREEIQYEILEKIVQNSKFKMNQKEVAETADRIEQDYKGQAEMYGFEFADFIAVFFEQTEEEFEKSKVKYAEEEIQFKLVLQEIAKKEKLGVTDAEYDKQIVSLAEEYGYESREDLEADYDKQSNMGDMITEKVYEFLVENGKAETPSKESSDEALIEDTEEIEIEEK